MAQKDLLAFTRHGIYCEAGDFYIDPWKPVQKALITHAHSDHARPGSAHYLAHQQASAVMKLRLGEDIQLDTVTYGETRYINQVAVSFHPAGHIPGSAQISVTHKGETWVVSGDYKLEDDGLSTPFEPVRCHTFITESTFGLPVYRWKPQQTIFGQINNWWEQNQQEGKISVLFGYALGKAQRLLSGLSDSLGPVYVHGAVWNVLEAMPDVGKRPADLRRVGPEYSKKDYQGAIIVAPPSAAGSIWMRKFQPYSTAMASGWMALRGMKRRRAMDQGFVISDHADWPGLLAAIEATGAQRVIATHGFTNIFSRYLQEKGLEATAAETRFTGETLDSSEDATPVP
jgi:putative mRNA 3-end processing factor